MRRKILAILLALALCVCMATTAFAAPCCKQPTNTVSAYEQLRQYLTCWLFGYGCRPNQATPCTPQAPSCQTPVEPEPSEPVTEDVPETPSPEKTPEPEKPTPEKPAPEKTPEPEKTEPTEPKPEKPNGSSVSTMEQQVVTLVNKQRAAYGLSALTLDESLSGYARIKSQDLHDNRYFDHQSPTYGSPFDMMRSFGITYSYAGENIAMGYYSAEDVVTAWMNSSGHRANILSANYNRIGVGYVADGGYWTQWFLG